jgi:hypothetical protein
MRFEYGPGCWRTLLVLSSARIPQVSPEHCHRRWYDTSGCRVQWHAEHTAGRGAPRDDLPVVHPTDWEQQLEQKRLKAPFTVNDLDDKRALRRVSVPEVVISHTVFDLPQAREMMQDVDP